MHACMYVCMYVHVYIYIYTHSFVCRSSKKIRIPPLRNYSSKPRPLVKSGLPATSPQTPDLSYELESKLLIEESLRTLRKPKAFAPSPTLNPKP